MIQFSIQNEMTSWNSSPNDENYNPNITLPAPTHTDNALTDTNIKKMRQLIKAGNTITGYHNPPHEALKHPKSSQSLPKDLIQKESQAHTIGVTDGQ